MARSIATNTTVELAELLDFARPRHRMLLATTRRDGRPQISPVSAGVDFQGRIVISTYPSRAKTRNAERDLRVSESPRPVGVRSRLVDFRQMWPRDSKSCCEDDIGPVTP
jgi:Pyridoxamine 5'-phosphate oxidase